MSARERVLARIREAGLRAVEFANGQRVSLASTLPFDPRYRAVRSALASAGLGDGLALTPCDVFRPALPEEADLADDDGEVVAEEAWLAEWRVDGEVVRVFLGAA